MIRKPTVEPAKHIEFKIEVDAQSHAETASLVLESDADENFVDLPILGDSSDEGEPASNRPVNGEPEENEDDDEKDSEQFFRACKMFAEARKRAREKNSLTRSPQSANDQLSFEVEMMNKEWVDLWNDQRVDES